METTRPGAISQESAIEQWLWKMSRSADPRGFRDTPEATFRAYDERLDIGLRRIHQLRPVILAHWIHRQPRTAAYPLPHQRQRRLDSWYTPKCWRVNAATEYDADNLQYPVTSDAYITEGPRRSVEQVYEAWEAVTTLLSETGTLRRTIAREDASWSDVTAFAFAKWVRKHPYPLVLPFPLRGTDSCYHPQSWVINTDSPYLHTQFADRTGSLGKPPKHLSTDEGNTIQGIARSSQTVESATVEREPRDPFDEFR